jgi:Cu/Ag efflux pump CusA
MRPLSWAVIYGLTFATFLTLIMVPVMLLIIQKIKHRRQWKRSLHRAESAQMLPPDMGPALQ